MNFITRAYVSMKTEQLALKNKLAGLKKDEAGIGGIIATVLILILVVTLYAVFHEVINEFFADLMNRVFGDGNPDNFEKPNVTYPG